MKAIVFLFLVLLFQTPSFANDVKGSKDYPLLTRYPESTISDYSKNYNSIEFITGNNEAGEPVRQAIEGDAYDIRYFYKDIEHQASPLQIIRNYQNAIKSIEGVVIYERLPTNRDGGETTLKVNSDGKEIWIKIEPEIYSAPTQSYRMRVVEVAQMEQAISANKLLESLNKDGFVTLYINFDTGKWDLKQDGVLAANEIVKMLKLDPNLRLKVEGHTDNVGNAEANKILSEKRAKSVLNAIVLAGIEGARLQAIGYGQEKPIADNRTEEGRSKNRRVELVKE